jgi:hypothetical protein
MPLSHHLLVSIMMGFLDQVVDIVTCVRGIVLACEAEAAHFALELFDVLRSVAGIGEFNAKEYIWACVPVALLKVSPIRPLQVLLREARLVVERLKEGLSVRMNIFNSRAGHTCDLQRLHTNGPQCQVSVQAGLLGCRLSNPISKTNNSVPQHCVVVLSDQWPFPCPTQLQCEPEDEHSSHVLFLDLEMGSSICRSCIGARSSGRFA